MACVDELAEFVAGVSGDDLSEVAREQLRIRILDALGCAIGGLQGRPVRIIREQIADFDGSGRCTLIGGGRAAPDRAALYNGALVRYLDFNDSYVARAETCHPSDNLAALLAAGEYAGGSGSELMVALALAYQVQCRLSDAAPVRAAGFDYTTQGAFAVAAGVARMLGLDRARTAHALAIAGTAFHGLRAARTGCLSHWKGLAYPYMAAGCTGAAFLAMRGITGPLEVIEGEKGLMDAVTGIFELHWAGEDLERVRRTVIKKHSAETHSQTAIEAMLELKRRHHFTADDVQHVEAEVFDVAYHTIGGGEDGDCTGTVNTREQADHSLPYLLAVALLDGRVTPEQYRPERIGAADVQAMLRAVTIRPNAAFSRAFPGEMPCRVRIVLRDGRVLDQEMREYPGFFTQPVSWDTAARKFEMLAEPHTTAELRRAIHDAVANLEHIRVAELMEMLGRVEGPS